MIICLERHTLYIFVMINWFKVLITLLPINIFCMGVVETVMVKLIIVFNADKFKYKIKQTENKLLLCTL